MAQGCLTGRQTSRTGRKLEHSDPVVPYGRAIAQRIKGSPIKVARELGSERRETVRSLSVVGVEICRALTLVREDRVGPTAGLSVMPPGVMPSS